MQIVESSAVLQISNAEDTPRPVTVLAQAFSNGARTRWHSHRKAQLLHATGGLLVLHTEAGTWTAPAGHAILVPRLVPHELAAYGCTEMRAAFLTEDALGPLRSDEVRVLQVSPLLDITLRALMNEPALYDLDGRGGHLEALIVDELRKAPETLIALPMPETPKLRKLCRSLMETPSLGHDIDEWARTVGVSRSTLTRRFRSETGLSFAEWRRRLRILHTLTLAAEGVPLRKAARLTGYNSPNALRDMMRRTLRSNAAAPE